MASSHKSGRPVGSKRRRPNGRWQVCITRGLREDGSPRTVYETVDTEEEADARLAELAVELGSRPDLGRGVTLARWWEVYRDTRGARLARATLDRYAISMDKAWVPAMGECDISMLDRGRMQAVVLAAPSRSEAHERVKALSAVLTQAVRDGVLESNPLRGAALELPGDVGAADSSGVDYDEDPFGAIEGTRDVWDAGTVLRAMPLLRGAPLEGCWLCMVGAGLRREEALALRWRDVRRVDVGGRSVVQLAVHAALTKADGRKRAKTARSVRIVAVSEPMASRLWELRGRPGEPVCAVSPKTCPRAWRKMWEPLSGDPHTPKSLVPVRGRMLLADPPIPYIPLCRMRATHETLMQEAGVLDSVNAATHGHSQRVSYEHYQRPDLDAAAERMGRLLLIDGEGDGMRYPPPSSANVT